MDARTVDDAARELRELRHDEELAFVLAPVTFALAVVSTQVWPSLAMPVFAGGLYLAVRAIRAAFRHYCLMDDLSLERDAYAIPEVAKRARRAATMSNRRSMAASIRGILDVSDRQGEFADQLEELAAELEREDLDLDPALAVACQHLVSDARTRSEERRVGKECRSRWSPYH